MKDFDFDYFCKALKDHCDFIVCTVFLLMIVALIVCVFVLLFELSIWIGAIAITVLAIIFIPPLFKTISHQCRGKKREKNKKKN